MLHLHKEKDDDDMFAQFVASELRSIEDTKLKRLTKWKIQSVLFGALNSFSTVPQPLTASAVPWDPPQPHANIQVSGFERPSPTPSIYTFPPSPFPAQEFRTDLPGDT